jgi:hypothetical protein
MIITTNHLRPLYDVALPPCGTAGRRKESHMTTTTTETHTLTCWHCGNDFVYWVPEELRGRGFTRDFFEDSTVCAACAQCRPNCSNPEHLN